MWYLDIYFLFGFIFSLLGFYYLKNGFPEQRLEKIFKVEKKREFLGRLLIYSLLCKTSYLIWFATGLFTSYWIVFSFLLFITFILFCFENTFSKSYSYYIRKISLLFESVVTFLLSINYFHIGVNISDVILNFF